MFWRILVAVIGMLLPGLAGASTRRATDTSNIVPIGVRNFGDQAYALHVAMGDNQWFNFSISNTHAYTAVAGTACTQCSAISRYNPALSTTYLAPTGNNTKLALQYNGKNITGGLAVENCAFPEANATNTWWWYNQTKIVVAGNGSDLSAFPVGSGIAGFGLSGVSTFTDSIVGHWINSQTDPLAPFVFALALYPTSVNTTANGTPLQGDSSGGFLHINGADPDYYTGSIVTQNVVGTSTLGNFGSVPTQLGSYDWTIQTQGWLFKNGNAEVNGGQGMYATVEAAYPYIMLPQHDAYTIYAAISGAKPYVVKAGATTATGQLAYSDDLSLVWTVPCSIQNVVMYINFQGVSIPLSPQDMFTVINGQCVGNIRGWVDPSRSTAILGNAFFRNAYVVFSASQNTAQNTVGIANRLVASRGKNGPNTKVIVGAVIGGIAFLLILAGLVFFIIRQYKRRPRAPPSAIFTGQAPRSANVRTGSGDDASRTKSPSSFFGFGSTFKADDTFVAEPWVPPTEGVKAEQVVIQPWTPGDGSEQAFLSPTGTTSSLPYQPPPSSNSSHAPQQRNSLQSLTSMHGSPAGSPPAFGHFGTSPQPTSLGSHYFPNSVSSQTAILPQTTYFSAPPPGASPPTSPQYHPPPPHSDGARPLPQVPFGNRTYQ